MAKRDETPQGPRKTRLSKRGFAERARILEGSAEELATQEVPVPGPSAPESGSSIHDWDASDSEDEPRSDPDPVERLAAPQGPVRADLVLTRDGQVLVRLPRDWPARAMGEQAERLRERTHLLLRLGHMLLEGGRQKRWTRKEAALLLGVDESTVERVVKQKLVALPGGGTVELERFFGTSGKEGPRRAEIAVAMAGILAEAADRAVELKNPEVAELLGLERNYRLSTLRQEMDGPRRAGR